MPAGNPWQRPTIASPEDRFAMVQLALSDDRIVVSNCEINRVGPSYAIDTVIELMETFEADRFTWILGSDALAGIESWHRIRELAELVDFLAIVRPGYHLDQSRIPDFIRWQVRELGALDISATEIRHALHEHRDVSSMLTEPVSRYIRENGLYGAA